MISIQSTKRVIDFTENKEGSPGNGFVKTPCTVCEVKSVNGIEI